MTTTALRVPYVTAWSDEEMPHPLLSEHSPEAAGLRLTYPDPHPGDWEYGVLRARHGIQRGGRPEWTRVNTLRQWQCMQDSLCQVCGQSAVDPESGRIWWLLTDADGTGDGYTNAPPTCKSCVPEAIASCPRLRTSAMVCTVASSEPYAVLGDLFALTEVGAALVERNALVELEAFHRLARVLAQQLVVTLHGLLTETL